MVPTFGYFIFSRNFVIRQIQRCWFQILQCCFQIPVQKYPNQVFLVPNLRIFIFALSFATRQIQGRWFQIRQKIFFQIPAQKYPNNAFLVPNLDIFIFFMKFCNYTNSRMLISNMIILLSNSSPEINEHAFLIPNLRIFIFALNFAIRQIRRRWFQIWQYFLQLSAQKYQKIMHFWSQI